MLVNVKLKYLRIAPRKVRLVADLIRRKNANEAKSILQFLAKKASVPLLKLLNSAIDSAKKNFQTEESGLYVSKITVDEGPKLKRWRARARGRSAEIQKKTSHITLVLTSEDKLIKKKKKKEETKKEEKSKETKIKPKIRPELKISKPISKAEKGIKRIFRRKAF